MVGNKPKIRPIAIGDLDGLGVDDIRRLYWQDEPVQTAVHLTRWQTVAAVVAALSLAFTSLPDFYELVHWVLHGFG